nr:MAG TPA: hypothetical protein [Caudoviricetes sp.]
MSEIGALISAASAIACALIAAWSNRRAKDDKAQRERVEARAAQRAKEGRLQLEMLHANSKLTVGVAMALKRGHCNGEVEAGLEAIKKADQAYAAFLEGIAVDHLTKDGR